MSIPSSYAPERRNNQENSRPTNSPEKVEEALEQIDRTLRQMLLLAELSASDAVVERERLQKVLDRLKARIDQIADTI